MRNEDKNLLQVRGYIPKFHDNALREISKKRKISISRLVAFAIDNELCSERPFKFDTELSTEEIVEYAYADEAGKILNFVKTLRIGAGLDILLLLRFEMGVPNKSVFLAAFKECLDKGMLEAFVPPVPRGRNVPPVPEGYFYYRISNQPTAKQIKNKASRYDKYLKLKKELEKEGML